MIRARVSPSDELRNYGDMAYSEQSRSMIVSGYPELRGAQIADHEGSEEARGSVADYGRKEIRIRGRRSGILKLTFYEFE